MAWKILILSNWLFVGNNDDMQINNSLVIMVMVNKCIQLYNFRWYWMRIVSQTVNRLVRRWTEQMHVYYGESVEIWDVRKIVLYNNNLLISKTCASTRACAFAMHIDLNGCQQIQNSVRSTALINILPSLVFLLNTFLQCSMRTRMFGSHTPHCILV